MGHWGAIGQAAGDIGSAWIGAEAERRGRHEAQGILREQQAQARGDLTSAYDIAEGQYDLIDTLLRDHYARSQERLAAGYGTAAELADLGYQRAIGETQSGYKGAMDETRAGYKAAMGQAREGYGAARKQFMPWQQSGESANKAIADLNGLNGPEAQSNAYAKIQYDPGYKARVDQANQALSRSALAQGNIFSGNFANALQTQNQNMASNEWGNYYARLMGVSGQGMNAAGNVANLYGSEADRLSGYSIGQGRDIGNLYTGQGRDLTNLYTSQGLTAADIAARKGTALSASEEALAQQRAGYQGNRAMLSANRGTSLANVAMGYGNKASDFAYSGGINRANLYGNAASGIAKGAGIAYGDYLAGKDNQDYNPYGGRGTAQDRYTQYKYSNEYDQSNEG